jgi:hypothetical protein
MYMVLSTMRKFVAGAGNKVLRFRFVKEKSVTNTEMSW